MEPLAKQLLERLARGEPDPEAFALVGAPEPAATAAAFLRASRHADTEQLPTLEQEMPKPYKELVAIY